MWRVDDLPAFVSARLDEGGLPPRVIEALRKLLAEIGKAQAESDAEDTIVISYYVASDLRGIIAAIWDGHPDYRQEWKPWASLPGAEGALNVAAALDLDVLAEPRLHEPVELR